MELYKTKDDIIAAIFLSLGFNLRSTVIDEHRSKVLFVFDISDVEGRALETLIKKKDPRIKVVAGNLYDNLSFVRSWLYLSRIKMRSMSAEEIENIARRINPPVLDDSPPLKASDIAEEILKATADMKKEEDPL